MILECSINGNVVHPDTIEKVVIYYFPTGYGNYKNKNIDIELEPLGFKKNFALSDEDVKKSNIKFKYHFKEAIPVKVINNLDKLEIDLPTEPGHYLVVWVWKFNNDVHSNRKHIEVNEPIHEPINYAPGHITLEGKYETLFEQYLPSMYKTQLHDDDLTPEILYKMNQCAADIFTNIENSANRLIDLFDANLVNSKYLDSLANIFNIELKSSDKVLWRRQIKEAVPLFKQKGTYEGLKRALAQAGYTLHSLTRLWQVTSKHIWIDSFTLENKPIKLTYIPIEDIEVLVNDENYNDYSLNNINGEIYLDIKAIIGSRVKVQYTIMPYSSLEEEELDKYILSLPLADARHNPDYPKKNWNIHLLEESDPLFDVIIKEKHPYYDWVVWGKIRTTFAYGEKVYNMDTFNGSLRNSLIPCDMDKDFIDTCSYGLSSKFNVDITTEELSNDTIEEIYKIIKEYSPFHAMVNSMNIITKMQDFIAKPEEYIKSSAAEDSKDRVKVKDRITCLIEEDGEEKVVEL